MKKIAGKALALPAVFQFIESPSPYLFSISTGKVK